MGLFHIKVISARKLLSSLVWHLFSTKRARVNVWLPYCTCMTYVYTDVCVVKTAVENKLTVNNKCWTQFRQRST